MHGISGVAFVVYTPWICKWIFNNTTVVVKKIIKVLYVRRLWLLLTPKLKSSLKLTLLHSRSIFVSLFAHSFLEEGAACRPYAKGSSSIGLWQSTLGVCGFDMYSMQFIYSFTTSYIIASELVYYTVSSELACDFIVSSSVHVDSTLLLFFFFNNIFIWVIQL